MSYTARNNSVSSSSVMKFSITLCPDMCDGDEILDISIEPRLIFKNASLFLAVGIVGIGIEGISSFSSKAFLFR